jgi:hypothetical protein
MSANKEHGLAVRGRPPIEGVSKSVRITIRTTPARKKAAEQLAAGVSLSLSVWIERLIDHYAGLAARRQR